MRSLFIPIRALAILSETLAQHRGKVLLAFSTGLVFCLCGALQWSHRPIPTKPAQIIETAPLLPRALPSETQPDGTNGESASDPSIDTGSSDSIRRAEPTSSPSLLSQTKASLRPYPTVSRTAGRKSKDSVRRSGDQPEETNAEIGIIRPGAWAAPQPSELARLKRIPC